MRKAVYNLLTGDQEFMDLIGGRLFSRGSVIDLPDKPFAIYAMTGAPRSGRSLPGRPTLEVWAYEERGSYTTVDSILKRADALLENVPHFFEDEVLAETVPQGWSSDLYDDVFLANTRSSTHIVFGSGQ